MKMAKSDFISRKALLKDLRKELRECQADANEFGGENILWAEGIEFAIDSVKDAKSVDAVEVVRCKDCQFFDKRGYEEDNRQQAMPELDFGWCSVLYRIEQACNFCSSGERKDNG